MKNSYKHKHYQEQITVALSMLCTVHCILTPVLMFLLPVAGAYFERYHWVEYILIASVFVLGTSAILHGYKDHHHNKIPAYIFFGGLVLLGSSVILKLLFEVDNISIHYLSGLGGITCGFAQLYNLKLDKVVE